MGSETLERLTCHCGCNHQQIYRKTGFPVHINGCYAETLLEVSTGQSNECWPRYTIHSMSAHIGANTQVINRSWGVNDLQDIHTHATPKYLSHPGYQIKTSYDSGITGTHFEQQEQGAETAMSQSQSREQRCKIHALRIEPTHQATKGHKFQPRIKRWPQ